MQIIEQQNLLFEQLRQCDPDVIDDGIADETEYTTAPYRLMFVLKEVNGGSGWSLCEHLKNGGRQQAYDATWDNIARWTEGIFSLPEELPWLRLEDNCAARRKTMLQKICAVNVKKLSGGSESKRKEIYAAAQENAEILRKQLALYAPELIICCGAEKAFLDACFPTEKIDWKMTTRGIWYFTLHNYTTISFSHPAARVRDCYLYYALLDAVREILRLPR